MLLFFLFEKWENWGAFLLPFPFLKINEVSLSPHTAFSGARTHYTFPYIRKKRGWMHKISAPATQIERDFSFLPFSRTPHFPLKNSRKRKNPGKCIFLSFPARGSVGEMGVSDLLFPNFIGGGEGRRSASNRISSAEKVGKKKKKFCVPLRWPRSGRTLKAAGRRVREGLSNFRPRIKEAVFTFLFQGNIIIKIKNRTRNIYFLRRITEPRISKSSAASEPAVQFYLFFSKKRKHLGNYIRHIPPPPISTCASLFAGKDARRKYSLLTFSQVYPTTSPASLEAEHWKTPLSSRRRKEMCSELLDIRSNLGEGNSTEIVSGEQMR